MTIDEALQLRQAAEEEIRRLLNTLEETTQLRVNSLYVAHTPALIGKRYGSLTDVRIDLRLPE